jgi:dipicolinate synthase subunit A
MVSSIRVAVLGGDEREVYIAERLAAMGYRVAAFGSGANHSGTVWQAGSAEEAVREASWIICPSPGLGAGDRVYAPHSTTPITLSAGLLAASAAAAGGGLILGRATPGVAAAARQAGVPTVEMKDDRSLAVCNATAVAEALVALLIGKTRRVLPQHTFLVIGYGAAGAACTDALLALTCRVSVAARRPESLERARQRGAAPVPFPARIAAMTSSDVIVNTVPSPEAIPRAALPALSGAIVIDIASPPGGMDHQTAEAAGVNVTWARGLAGARAPLTAGDAQLRFITRAIEDRRDALSHSTA